MKSGLLAIMVLTLAAFPTFAEAQGTASGYAFVGPSWELGERQGGTIGGGGEVVTGWKGTTIGLEAAGLWFPARETGSRFAHPITARSVALSMSRHFYQSSGLGRWQPYVTGGVSIVASGDVAGAGFAIGGGVDRWFTRRAGLRIDVRDQVVSGAFSVVGVRAGIVFR